MTRYHASFNPKTSRYERRVCNAKSPKSCPLTRAIPGVVNDSSSFEKIDRIVDRLNRSIEASEREVKNRTGLFGKSRRRSPGVGKDCEMVASTETSLRKMVENGVSVSIISSETELSFSDDANLVSSIDILGDDFKIDSTDPSSFLRKNVAS